MHRPVHVIIGAVAALFFASSTYMIPLCAIMGAIGGYMPDFDLRFKHRKTLHNIFSLIIGSIVLYILLGLVPIDMLHRYIWQLVLSFSIGWLLHIFCDGFTKRGVYLFWPFSNKSYGPKLFRSNSFASLALGFGIAFGLLLSWLIYSGYIEIILDIIRG
ncbi:MAG: metal-dependent hydrolase [Crenarchaeota archaeon]|nr:metal-dependent hydrolase [Thermoproteota archaeon]